MEEGWGWEGEEVEVVVVEEGEEPLEGEEVVEEVEVDVGIGIGEDMEDKVVDMGATVKAMEAMGPATTGTTEAEGTGTTETTTPSTEAMVGIMATTTTVVPPVELVLEEGPLEEELAAVVGEDQEGVGLVEKQEGSPGGNQDTCPTKRRRSSVYTSKKVKKELTDFFIKTPFIFALLILSTQML